MQQYQCLLVANECYQRGRMMTPTKIVVHSTAANNTSISRYVQPAPGQTAGLMQYQSSERRLTAAQMREILGTNRYGNDWNREGLYVCVHAFLGRLADGSLAVCQTLPWKMRCWGVGSGRKGSYNDCSIQFEICEDDHRDAAYCRDTFELAAELCAHLMRAYPTITEIVSHNEAGQRGYGSDHNDPDNWWPRHGYTMGMLRRRVAELLAGKPQQAPEPSGKEIFRIRKSWGDASSQIGAYSDLGNAIAACPTGYSVYGPGGKAVYSGGTTVVPDNKVQPPKQYTAGYRRGYVVRANGGLNLRKGPGTQYASLRVMPDGSKCSCYGYHTGEWLYVVDAAGTTGYAKLEYLERR